MTEREEERGRGAPATAGVSVVVPVRDGGELLLAVARSVLAQEGAPPCELVAVDSGSSEAERRELERAGARVLAIDAAAFNHGSTRDLGARAATGDVLVFLNQDALPVDEHWLERLVSPFAAPEPPAAVQGGIREFPVERLAELGRRRFFWESCGPRFYFTRESEGWIGRHGGIGFSTVNCAISRRAWEELPFGPAPILEDKSWQKRAHERGWRIDEAPDAAVFHTHDYDLGGLLRRCASEGLGWRHVGERYRLATALGDLAKRSVWREWRRGVAAGEMRRPAEILFPLVRPLALWWGNRFLRRSRA